MGITAITRDYGDNVSIVRITTTDTLATASAANYILNQAANIEAVNSGAFSWLPSDMTLVYASNGWMFANISTDFLSLTPFVFSTTVTGTPVTVGHLAVFTSTSGNIGQNAATAINGGNIQAGSSGTAGTLASFPAAATSGSLVLAAVANSGNFNVTLSNLSHGQSTVYSISDAGTATGNLLNKSSAAFVSGNLIAASGTTGLTVDSGFAASSLPQFVSVTMTAAQWNAMYATPFLLIAAPGAGNMIIVNRMEAIMTYGTTAYAAGGVVAAQYGATAHGAGPAATNTEAAADFFATASTTFLFNGVSGNTVGAVPFSTSSNTGIYLSNATGAFTTGDSTWTIMVQYRTIAI
jgi:hypothetical protein